MNTFLEILIVIISFVMLGGLLLSPFFIIKFLNKTKIKYKFLTYVFIGLLTSAILAILFAWWGDASNEFLLYIYGYDFDAMNDAIRFRNVKSEDIERVKRLEISMMGVGWPAKAILGYLVYSPYLFFVYLVIFLWNKFKSRISKSRSIN